MAHRELSEGIRAGRVQDIKDNGADLVVTQCPVCRFYIGSALKEQDTEIVHPMIMLARAYGIEGC